MTLSLLLLSALVACGGKTETSESDSVSAEKAAVIRFWNLFREATTERLKGDCAAAVPTYEEALRLNPKHEDSLYYLGQCRRERGDYVAAREAYARLAEVNPHSARGHLAMGALLASVDDAAPMDLTVAEKEFRRAHEINGEETGPMVRLGEVLIVEGRLDEARQWLESAARTNPKSVEAPFLIGYLRWLSGDSSGAREAYLRAAKAAKTDVPVKGVLSEGDRKAASVPDPRPAVDPGKAPPPTPEGKIAAPPLKEPMGKTLFGAFSSPLRGGAPPDPGASPESLDRIYAPVRDYASRLRARAGAPVSRGEFR